MRQKTKTITSVPKKGFRCSRDTITTEAAIKDAHSLLTACHTFLSASDDDKLADLWKEAFTINIKTGRCILHYLEGTPLQLLLTPELILDLALNNQIAFRVLKEVLAEVLVEAIKDGQTVNCSLPKIYALFVASCLAGRIKEPKKKAGDEIHRRNIAIAYTVATLEKSYPKIAISKNAESGHNSSICDLVSEASKRSPKPLGDPVSYETVDKVYKSLKKSLKSKNDLLSYANLNIAFSLRHRP